MGRELRLTIASHDIHRARALRPSITTCTTTTTSIMTTTIMRTSLSAMGTIMNESQLSRAMRGSHRTARLNANALRLLANQDSCSTTMRLAVTTTSTMTTMMMVNKLEQKRLQSTYSLRRSDLRSTCQITLLGGGHPSSLPLAPRWHLLNRRLPCRLPP